MKIRLTIDVENARQDDAVEVVWGDGNADGEIIKEYGDTSVSLEHKYKSPGDKELEVTVSDGGDNKDLVRKQISVWPAGQILTAKKTSYRLKRQIDNSYIKSNSTISYNDTIVLDDPHDRLGGIGYYADGDLRNRWLRVGFRAKCTGDECPSMGLFIRASSWAGWHAPAYNAIDAQWRIPNDGKWHWVETEVHLPDQTPHIPNSTITSPDKVMGIILHWRTRNINNKNGWKMPKIEIDTNADVTIIDRQRKVFSPNANKKPYSWEGELVRINSTGSIQIKKKDKWTDFLVKGAYVDWTNPEDQTWASDAGYNVLLCDTISRARGAVNAGMRFILDFAYTIFENRYTESGFRRFMQEFEDSGLMKHCIAYYADIEYNNIYNIEMMQSALKIIDEFDRDGGERKRPTLMLQSYVGTHHGMEYMYKPYGGVQAFGIYGNNIHPLMENTKGTIYNNSATISGYNAKHMKGGNDNVIFTVPQPVTHRPQAECQYALALYSGCNMGWIHWHQPHKAYNSLLTNPSIETLTFVELEKLWHKTKAMEDSDISIDTEGLIHSRYSMHYGHFYSEGKHYLCATNTVEPAKTIEETFKVRGASIRAIKVYCGQKDISRKCYGDVLKQSNNTFKVILPADKWVCIEIEV